MRLIDADEAIKKIDDFCKKENIDIRDNPILKATRTFILNMETIDINKVNEVKE